MEYTKLRAFPSLELSGLRVKRLGFTVCSIRTVAADASLWRVLTGAPGTLQGPFGMLYSCRKAHHSVTHTRCPTCQQECFGCAGHPFNLDVEELMLDWTTDRNGATHFANLLSEAGLIQLPKPGPCNNATEASPTGMHPVWALHVCLVKVS